MSTRWVAWWDSITSHHPESQEGTRYLCLSCFVSSRFSPGLYFGCILVGLVSWDPAGLRRLGSDLKFAVILAQTMKNHVRGL